MPSVYFAMGLPFIALNLVAVIMFDDLGVDKAQIAFWTSLLTLPTLLNSSGALCSRSYWTKRNFVIATQAISGFCFGVIAFLLPLPGFFSFTIAMMAGDSIFGCHPRHSPPTRLHRVAGRFHNLAKVLANGGLVWLAGYLITSFKATDPERAPSMPG